MKTKEFIELKDKLDKQGYRATNSISAADRSYYKAFRKYNNPWCEERACYQIFYEVWDFTQFHDPNRQYGVQVCIDVSRIATERCTLKLPYEGQPISYFEEKAESFYEWVVKNIEI